LILGQGCEEHKKMFQGGTGMRIIFCIGFLVSLLFTATFPTFVHGADKPASLIPVTAFLLSDKTCRLSIEELAAHYAEWAGSRVAPEDRDVLLAEAGKYAAGGAPPYFVESAGEPSLVIPPRGQPFMFSVQWRSSATAGPRRCGPLPRQ